jgi:hypothetical protein
VPGAATAEEKETALSRADAVVCVGFRHPARQAQI